MVHLCLTPSLDALEARVAERDVHGLVGNLAHRLCSRSGSSGLRHRLGPRCAHVERGKLEVVWGAVDREVLVHIVALLAEVEVRARLAFVPLPRDLVITLTADDHQRALSLSRQRGAASGRLRHDRCWLGEP